MTKRIMATMLAFTLAITSISTSPARAADSGEIGRFLLGAGTLFIIGSAISNSNRNNNHGTVTRRHDRDTYTHVQPRRKIVPSACLRKNRSDHGPRRYFSRHCLRKNMANFHRIPDHCARNVWTKRGKRIGYAARCLRNNGWVFG